LNCQVKKDNSARNGAKSEKDTHTIAFFGGGFQLETTFERTGIGALKIDHAKEQNLFYNLLTFGSD
jgi:hypothetical protein